MESPQHCRESLSRLNKLLSEHSYQCRVHQILVVTRDVTQLKRMCFAHSSNTGVPKLPGVELMLTCLGKPSCTPEENMFDKHTLGFVCVLPCPLRLCYHIFGFRLLL